MLHRPATTLIARRAALAVGLTAVIACATNQDDLTASVQRSTGAPEVNAGPARVAPSAGQITTTAGVGFGLVTYHGGPVIPNVAVSIIYWSSAVAFQETLPSFYATVTNSNFFDWLREYPAGAQRIGRGGVARVVVDTGAPGGTSIQQWQIEAELTRLIQNGTLSSPGPNDLYMVYFPPGVTVFAGGWFSCTPTDGFCGFHTMFSVNGTNAYYGVIADLAPCGSRCGPGDALANTTATSSHELLEAVTDPFTGPDNGWFDGTNPNQTWEISDICQDMQANVSGFTVQKAWSQQQEACVFRNPCLECASGTSCHCGDFVCRKLTSQCP
jgi:hypothetical protein